MRDPRAYGAVFSEKIDIHIWPAIVEITKRVEGELEPIRDRTGEVESRFLAKWRALVSLLVVARLTGTFEFSVDQLIGLDFAKITRALVESVWADIESSREPGTKRVFRKGGAVRRCCEFVADRYGVRNPEHVGIRVIPTGAARRDSGTSYLGKLSDEFLKIVDDALPAQPWKPGVHSSVAKKISSSRAMVSAAIQELIARGKRNQQRDGVVYDKDGTVIARDMERIAELNKEPEQS